MPDATTCPECKTGGFVQSERVVKGGASHIQFYCGACEYPWTDDSSDETPSKTDPPDRSRHRR